MTKFLILAIAWLTLPSYALTIGEVDGVYKYRFKNGLMSGERYESENIMEIVKVSDTEAYFVLSLAFANGHACHLTGVGEFSKDTLIYESLTHEECKLKIAFGKSEVVLGDPDNRCGGDSCGARGSYDGETFKRSQRRKIQYMERVLKSADYEAALAERRKLVEARRTGVPPEIADAPNRLWGWMVYGNLDKIKSAFDKGLLKDDPKMFWLHDAVRTNSLEVVRYFISRKWDVNQLNDKSETPLTVALISNQARAALLLIESGAKASHDQWGELLIASVNDSSEETRMSDDEVMKLIDRGADVNHVSSNDGKWTALTIVTQEKRPKLVKRLLEKGAKPDIASADGTPLTNAVGERDLETVKILLAHGADPNLKVDAADRDRKPLVSAAALAKRIGFKEATVLFEKREKPK